LKARGEKGGGSLKGRISEHRKSLKDKERKDGKSLNEGEEKMWRE
jgi:hypothetical protein